MVVVVGRVVVRFGLLWCLAAALLLFAAMPAPVAAISAKKTPAQLCSLWVRSEFKDTRYGDYMQKDCELDALHDCQADLFMSDSYRESFWASCSFGLGISAGKSCPKYCTTLQESLVKSLLFKMECTQFCRAAKQAKRKTGVVDCRALCAANQGAVEACYRGCYQAAGVAMRQRFLSDTVFLNGRVYTVDAKQPWAEAVCVSDGEISFVGSNADAQEHCRSSAHKQTDTVDLGGRLMLPGFVDAHVHPLMSGVETLQCDLSVAEDLTDALAVVADCVRDTRKRRDRQRRRLQRRRLLDVQAAVRTAKARAAATFVTRRSSLVTPHSEVVTEAKAGQGKDAACTAYNGECMATAKCKDKGGASTRGLCSGNNDNQCCTTWSTDAAPVWVVGGGWETTWFTAGRGPDRRVLDAISTDLPIYLADASGHAAWANSLAFALAGIDKDTPEPATGQVVREKDGGPRGMVTEEGMSLFDEVLPDPTPDELVRGLHVGLGEANRFGITAMIDANADADYLAAYRQVAEAGDLTAHMSISYGWDGQDATIQETVDAIVAVREQFTREEELDVRIHAVKLYMDGVVGSWTAALEEPYVHHAGDGFDSFPADWRGETTFSQRALNKIATLLDAAGFQLHVHAIGDRAVSMALDAVEKARAVNGPRDARHHIAHLQLVAPKDYDRFAALGVHANFQPLWMILDPDEQRLFESAVGSERAKLEYPMRSLLNEGAQVACGSDWSVTPMNVMWAIFQGVTGHNTDSPDFPQDPVYQPQERVSLEQMIECYTLGSAKLMFLEDKIGSIEVGKRADFVVMDRNIFEIDALDLHKAEVELTYFGGRVVFDADDESSVHH